METKTCPQSTKTRGGEKKIQKYQNFNHDGKMRKKKIQGFYCYVQKQTQHKNSHKCLY